MMLINATHLDRKSGGSPPQLFVPNPPIVCSLGPKRTRISYFALLATPTCAALRKESRMQIINATSLDRKSGGAQWRDLCVDALSWKCFSTERTAAERSAVCGFSFPFKLAPCAALVTLIYDARFDRADAGA
jgi:hypothetical protein